MDTRQALLVDAFADEPTRGTPTGVVPDGGSLTDEQRRAIARELGTATAFLEGADGGVERMDAVAPETTLGVDVRGAVAAYAHRYDRGRVDAGTHGFTTSDGSEATVDIAADGTVWTEAPRAEVRSVDATHEEAATALGVDVASLRDVGADLPLRRVAVGDPYLLVPVNYFERLSDASVDPGALADVLDRSDAAALYAFTFDTIDGEATAHGRTFVPGEGEVLPGGTGAGACGAYVRRQGALDGERDEIVVEGGHFFDRPGLVRVRTDGHAVDVGGRATTALDGDLVVPDPDEDDIIEV